MNNFYDIVFFHYPCQDGLASAWVTHYYHKLHNMEIKLYPIQYGREIDINIVKNKRVIFCDFTPSNDVLDKIEEECQIIKILDHHISAKERVVKEYAYYDISRSGAGITWDYFFESSERPNFINWIEDRDLWNWKYKESANFHAGFQMIISTLQYDDFKTMFEMYDEIIKNPDKIHYYLDLGDLINRSIQNKAKNIAHQHSKKINYYKDNMICIVNCPSEIISEVGSILTKDYNFDFAVLWRYDHPKEQYIVSLRANNMVDVSKIATKYGGGGHKNAASFSTQINPLILFDGFD